MSGRKPIGGSMEEGQDGSQSLEGFLASVERRAFCMAQMATRNTDDALDIVQDAMLGLVRHYAGKPPSQWKPLFYRILVSRIRDWYRRKTVRNRVRGWLKSLRAPDDDPVDPWESVPDATTDNPVDSLIVGESMAALEKALDDLPPRQQQAFLLRAWEGLSVKEAAVAMRCSPGSVKTHYARAVAVLRTRLENHRP